MTSLSRRHFLGAVTATAATPFLSASASASANANADLGSTQVPPGNPLFHRFQVGEIEVIALSDGFGPLPNGMINGFEIDPARAAARAAYKRFDPETFSVAINGFIIRTGERVVAVDTGAPGAMGPTVGHWHVALASAGISPDDIDTVFLTHAHGDHVGGLADLSGQTPVALLPNAELIMAEAEWEFTFSDEVLAQMPEGFRANFMASRALLSPYAEQRHLLSMTRESEIAPGVTAVPLPGHTPGHMGLRISDGADSLLIWGDTVHATAYQFMHPEWSIVFDADAAMGYETRARLLDMAASERMRVAGMHLDFPALGFVERAQEGYRYITAPSDPV